MSQAAPSTQGSRERNKMKSLVLFVGLMSAPSVWADTTLTCSVDPAARPHDTFRISFVGNQKATVRYQRSASLGSEEMPVIADLPGCAPSSVSQITSKKIYVECAGDGDAGVIDLNILQDGRVLGTIRFPEGNIGYREDTVLRVACRKS